MSDEQIEDKPALTIVIKSWWTPALAVVMLAVGLLAGYFGRPLLEKDETVTAPPRAAATNPPASNPQSITGVTIPEIKSQEELMAYLITQTRHFRGDADAPVTIIEFSDFQ